VIIKKVLASFHFPFAALALALVCSTAARAQEEGMPIVLDEPIVQVNNDVLMRSALNREIQEFKQVLITKRGMSEAQATEEIEKRRPEIIFNLINESLLVQKGKDLPGMTEDVEAEVNREMLRVAKQYNLKTIEELRAAMKADNQSLSDVQETLRKHFYRQSVLQNEVDRKVFFGITDADARKYHAENRGKFESVTLSEIFISLAGREETEVHNKAKWVVAEARAGKDFKELVAKYSERENKEKTQGLLGGDDGKARWFALAELSGPVGTAVKEVKAGGITDPIKIDEGYMILRVNERDNAYNDRQVRALITQERSEKEREDYMRMLRREAYIKPAKDYAPIIQPLLEKDIQATANKDATTAKNGKDKKNDKQ
jgi:parvulin-like peptidyl-prolyl isomerase